MRKSERRQTADGGRQTAGGKGRTLQPSAVHRPPSFFQQVYAVVRLIPRGKVATYGQVAAILEHPRAARTVGWALQGLSAQTEPRVPWHRVIAASGRISNTANYEEQLRRLKREGIQFDQRGTCDLRKYLWDAPLELRA